MLWFKLKLITLYFLVQNNTCTCHREVRKSDFAYNRSEYKVRRIGRLNEKVDESSGLAYESDSTFWSHNDSGGKPEIYLVNQKEEIFKTISLPKAKNYDWEALAKDKEGNIYCADIGNNKSIRKALKIYKINPSNPERYDSIMFKYEDQTKFPPDKKDLNFDCEGMFWLDGKLYLFSKNRGGNLVKYYTLSDQPGSQVAKLAPARIYLKTMITSADVSPDGKMFALLSYGKIFLFTIENKENLFEKPYKCVRFGRGGQVEGLIFTNDKDILVTSEKGKVYNVQKR